MPFGEKVQCSKCEKNESLMWHQVEKGVVCNECHENNNAPLVTKTPEEEEQKQISVPSEKFKSPMKKSTKTKAYKTRQNPNALPKPTAPKGKGRRHILKKNTPLKLRSPRSSFQIFNSLRHKGEHFRVGDVVSVEDVEGGIFYGQIHGLMMDEFCEKSASVTWLVPTLNTSPFARKGFDPLTFVAGPYDDLPRRLDCFTFVMHAPSDYFKDNCPYPTGLVDPRNGAGYIWGRPQ